MILLDRVRDWNTLRRLTPYRPEFGRRRGECIDRFYIEKFLQIYENLIRGVVGEFEGNDYTLRFGEDRVEKSEILDLNEKNTRRTIALDLGTPESVPQTLFDCVICTQTLFLVADYSAALQSLYRMLKPGGVLLATVPGICPIVRGELIAGAGEDWWRFTAKSARRIFTDAFGEANVAVHTYGNVLSSVAFLHGLVQAELDPEELQFHDPAYELVIGIVAIKAAGAWNQGTLTPLPVSEESAEPHKPLSKQIKHLVPRPIRQWLNLRREVVARKMIHIDRVTSWSALRRVRPYRERLGERRGACIDRYYIEKYLREHQDCIRGRVAEFLDNGYTMLYGGDRVTQSDVIDIDETNAQRTITLNLAQTDTAPEALFDAIICTQTLFLIFDFPAAVRTLHKMLKPGGAVLATFPGICQQLPPDMLNGSDGDWWRFTPHAAAFPFKEAFGAANTAIQTYGNVLTATALLHGLVQEELTTAELEHCDPDLPVIIAVTATRRA